MKRRFIIFTLFFIGVSVNSQSQNPVKYYQDAYLAIDSMLTGKTQLSFKKAVFFTENAYFEGGLNEKAYNRSIEILKDLAILYRNANKLIYQESDSERVANYAAIYKVMTDTISIILDTSRMFIHKPFTYDFEDMWGHKDWSKMFVSKLLMRGNGNCHSLPYLYKIIADEVGVSAYLAFAPNHIYIKLNCKETGWYNTELTSASFPIDAWIMASGYVHLDAIRNGLYMDTINTAQAIANCLVDLAQGYRWKYKNEDPYFSIMCTELALKYHPTNVNAMLVKAEAQKSIVEEQMKLQGLKNPRELLKDNSYKTLYAEMEQGYVRLHQLGYRRMPEEMYLQWLLMLKNEPEKYLNQQVIINFDKNSTK